MGSIDDDIESISEHLSSKQKDFDRVMELSRDIIREAAQSITLLHNNEVKDASKRLGGALKMVNALKKHDSVFGYHSRQAYQEYAEAKIFYEIKVNRSIPPLPKSGVDMESYLMGLMDVMGELKREILESLRDGNVSEAEEYFNAMKVIYDGTRSIRFAEAVLGGFRRKQDVARIQVESAGSEILSFKKKS